MSQYSSILVCMFLPRYGLLGSSIKCMQPTPLAAKAMAAAFAATGSAAAGNTALQPLFEASTLCNSRKLLKILIAFRKVFWHVSDPNTPLNAFLTSILHFTCPTTTAKKLTKALTFCHTNTFYIYSPSVSLNFTNIIEFLQETTFEEDI